MESLVGLAVDSAFLPKVEKISHEEVYIGLTVPKEKLLVEVIHVAVA